MTSAQQRVLAVLAANSHRLLGPGYVGSEVWGSTALGRQGYRGSACSAPYARVAGKVLNGLKKLGFAEYVAEIRNGKTEDWGWRATDAGRLCDAGKDHVHMTPDEIVLAATAIAHSFKSAGSDPELAAAWSAYGSALTHRRPARGTRMKRPSKKSRDEFKCGFAAAIGILQSGWREHGLVVLVLKESGLTYDDLRIAGADPYDLKLIREAFKSDGKKVR